MKPEETRKARTSTDLTDLEWNKEHQAFEEILKKGWKHLRVCGEHERQWQYVLIYTSASHRCRIVPLFGEKVEQDYKVEVAGEKKAHW